MQILGLALVLLAYLAWNAASGGLPGLLALVAPAALTLIGLFLYNRSARPHRVTLVTLGGLVSAVLSVLWLGGGTQPVGATAVFCTGALLGVAAACVVPAWADTRRRR